MASGGYSPPSKIPNLNDFCHENITESKLAFLAENHPVSFLLGQQPDLVFKHKAIEDDGEFKMKCVVKYKNNMYSGVVAQDGKEREESQKLAASHLIKAWGWKNLLATSQEKVTQGNF